MLRWSVPRVFTGGVHKVSDVDSIGNNLMFCKVQKSGRISTWSAWPCAWRAYLSRLGAIWCYGPCRHLRSKRSQISSGPGVPQTTIQKDLKLLLCFFGIIFWNPNQILQNPKKSTKLTAVGTQLTTVHQAVAGVWMKNGSALHDSFTTPASRRPWISPGSCQIHPPAARKQEENSQTTSNHMKQLNTHEKNKKKLRLVLEQPVAPWAQRQPENCSIRFFSSSFIFEIQKSSRQKKNVQVNTTVGNSWNVLDCEICGEPEGSSLTSPVSTYPQLSCWDEPLQVAWVGAVVADFLYSCLSNGFQRKKVSKMVMFRTCFHEKIQ